MLIACFQRGGGNSAGVPCGAGCMPSNQPSMPVCFLT